MLLAAAGVALVVARARPAVSPTVPIAEESAPDLYRLVRDLADRLDVPAPSAIALTPDCDSWLEDRTHPAHGPPRRRAGDEPAAARRTARRTRRRAPAAPVLVIGSPVPVVDAGRRAARGPRPGRRRYGTLGAPGHSRGPPLRPGPGRRGRRGRGARPRAAVARRCSAGVGWVARLLLRSCRVHAAEMERGVAAAAAERAQAVDYGLRIVAQEQVGLAYAGWDRLLTRVALPAWRMGRWPSRLDAGVVSALTELSRRDRLAEGFASRLGERPACDLLEEPGAVDEAASLLAARLFHGGPAEAGPDWSPVDWQQYPEEVVDRKWRTDAARLHRVLDALGVRRRHGPGGPTPRARPSARVLDHLTARRTPRRPGRLPATSAATDPATADDSRRTAADDPLAPPRTTRPAERPQRALAAGLSAELAREEAAARPRPPPPARGRRPGRRPLGRRPAAAVPAPAAPYRPRAARRPRHGDGLLRRHGHRGRGPRPRLARRPGPPGRRRTRARTWAARVLSLVEDGDPDPAARLARHARRPPGEAGPPGLSRVRRTPPAHPRPLRPIRTGQRPVPCPDRCVPFTSIRDER